MDFEAIIEKMDGILEKEFLKIDELYKLKDFPVNLWKGMAEEGLLGFNIPKQYGGLGFNNKLLIYLFEDLTRKGFPVGLALSWLTHLGLANFLILPFATEKQREFLLPKIAKGEITLSLAYGEIGSGGSPKGLKTKATYKEGNYIINGQKDFITNGNIAAIFAVFPITGQQEDIKEISAFLVSKDNEWLKTTKPIDVRNLNPSLHCSVIFKDCIVSDEDRIGDKGRAYNQILKPWREYEDIYLMGALIGSMKRQLVFAIDCLNNLSMVKQLEYGDIEELYSIFQVFKTIVYESVSMLDERVYNNRLSSLILSARNLAMKFQVIFKAIILKDKIEEDDEMKHVTGSINDLLNIAKGTIPVRQVNLGKKLINREDQ